MKKKQVTTIVVVLIIIGLILGFLLIKQTKSKEDIVTFSARDGQTVQAYLLKPEGQGKFPAIVWLHGGMSSISRTLSTKNLAEKYKEQGYVVLGPHYRSSEFGGKEIDDVIASINYLKTLDYVDKIAVLGTSHGAYMSLMTAIQVGNDIDAVVDNFGFTDLKEQFDKILGESYKETESTYTRWAEEIYDKYDLWEERSPVYNADKIQVPILIIHGKNDGNVPINQSYRLKQELENNQKIVELKEFEQGVHGFVYKNTNEAQEAFQTTLEFLNKYLN